MEKLKLSKNRKVSPKSKWQSGQAKPQIPNTIGLPAGDSCVGKTDWCKVCYADKIQKAWTSVDKVMWHNFEAFKSCGSNVSKMKTRLVEAISGINWRDEEKIFRWFWNGDIYSSYLARAIAQTCNEFPDIQFWIYSRSLDYVKYLTGIPNLTVYLSVDEFNIKKAKKLYDSVTPGTIWIAACGDTWEQTEDIMREVVGRNAPKCPELTGKIPLVSREGVGACQACGMCIYGRNHVRFSSNKEKGK